VRDRRWLDCAAICAACASTSITGTGTGDATPDTNSVARSASAASVSTSAASVSAKMWRMRSVGYAGSIGTYAAPAFRQAKMPTMGASDRSQYRAT
jgi:hypothetical protein